MAKGTPAESWMRRHDTLVLLCDHGLRDHEPCVIMNWVIMQCMIAVTPLNGVGVAVHSIPLSHLLLRPMG